MLSRSGLWLTQRQNREGAYRYDFQPSTPRHYPLVGDTRASPPNTL